MYPQQSLISGTVIEKTIVRTRHLGERGVVNFKVDQHSKPVKVWFDPNDSLFNQITLNFTWNLTKQGSAYVVLDNIPSAKESSATLNYGDDLVQHYGELMRRCVAQVDKYPVSEAVKTDFALELFKAVIRGENGLSAQSRA